MDDRQLANQLRRFFQVKDFDVDALLEQAKQQERSQRRRAWGAAIAASIAMLTLSLVYFVSSHPNSDTYTTTTGQESICLEDGSIAALNVESVLETEYSAQARDLYLKKGHGLFKVRRDPQRSFRVHVGSRIVIAVGTKFDVRIEYDQSTVAVIEGRIELEDASGASEPIPVAEGQAATIFKDGRVGGIRAVDIAAVTAWRQSQEQLKFRDQSLVEILREFNRYNAAPKFLIEGRGLEDIHRSLEFTSADPQKLLSYLREETEVELIQRDQDFVIRRRDDAGQSEML